MLNKLGYDVKADSYFGKDSVEALMAFHVITSYSIHYTKLYDKN